MKIDNIGINQANISKDNIKTEDKINKNEVNDSKAKKTDKQAAVYEKSNVEDKGHIYNKGTIDQLKRDSEKAYGYLKRIVEDMLRRQGMTMNDVTADVKIDEQARLEAQELIGEDGPLGIEAVSDRIVNFAKAISGGDKDKLKTLRGAIDQGFKEAEKMLGKLPEISQKTYDRIMEKLDAWELEE